MITLCDPTSRPPVARTGTVLVVEDEMAIREALALILQRAGYTVCQASNGREALHHLGTGPLPGLVLLDMMMPVMDGWQFLDARKRDPALASVPVLITTALGVAGPDWAAALGAVGCLRKPVDVNALLAEVQHWCGGAP